MLSNFTNLLPPKNLRTLRRDYYVRLAVTATIALAIVVVVTGVLLVPSRFTVEQEAAVQSRALSQIANTDASAEEQQLNQQLSTLSAQTQYLTTLSSVPTASGAFRALLAVSRPGITLSGFSYTAATSGNPGTMLLTGTADTREDLRAYVTALSAVKGVTNADLPISDYAQSSSIPFTITLTGPLASS